MIAVVLTLAGVLLTVQEDTTAHHVDYTHNNPEVILPGLESSDLPPRIVLNSPGPQTEYLVTSITDSLDSATVQAITNWNTGLRNFAPNSLNKYPLHFNLHDDPNANVIVVGYDSAGFGPRCSPGNHGCVQDDLIPDNDTSVYMYATPLYVIINLTAVTTEAHKRGDIAHELGHLLFLNEHYTPGTGNCGQGFSLAYTSVMDYWECDFLEGPAQHDRDDFYQAYKPQATPSGVAMAPSSSSSATLSWSNASWHNIARFRWVRLTDTAGSLVDAGDTQNKGTTSTSFGSIADGHRRCVRIHGKSDAGYQNGAELSPRSFYGCYSRVNGNAGRFLATSHRLYGSLIQVRNAASGTRTINVLGPQLQGVGCSPASVPAGGTYSCQAGVGIQQYADLFIIMSTSGGSQTLGAIDFD
ncbi:MAG TPA: hypothetical protein VNM91_10870 [Dehalococcoidia bacterium]|nr:hypothetical protein [Dehalococcoidia bacterium]